MNYKEGMAGTSIKVIQAKLLSMGYYGGKIDGIFGAETKRGVKLYQDGVDGLVTDGITTGGFLIIGIVYPVPIALIRNPSTGVPSVKL